MRRARTPYAIAHSPRGGAHRPPEAAGGPVTPITGDRRRRAAAVGGGIDYSQWAAILRAVSALTSYHWVYRQGLQPWLIADLLILNQQMPRSLAACYGAIAANLDRLSSDYGRHGESQRLARSILVQLENNRIEQIFQSGLHEFVTGFIANNNRLGGAVAAQYLS